MSASCHEPTFGFSLPEQNGIILALLVIPRDSWSSLVIRFYVEFERASLRVTQHLAADAVGTASPRRLRSRRGFAADERIRFVAGKCQKTTGVKGATRWRSESFSNFPA